MVDVDKELRRLRAMELPRPREPSYMMHPVNLAEWEAAGVSREWMERVLGMKIIEPEEVPDASRKTTKTG